MKICKKTHFFAPAARIDNPSLAKSRFTMSGDAPETDYSVFKTSKHICLSITLLFCVTLSVDGDKKLVRMIEELPFFHSRKPQTI